MLISTDGRINLQSYCFFLNYANFFEKISFLYAKVVIFCKKRREQKTLDYCCICRDGIPLPSLMPAVSHARRLMPAVSHVRRLSCLAVPHRPFVDLLSTFCRPFADLLPTFCRPFVEFLSTFYRGFHKPILDITRAVLEPFSRQSWSIPILLYSYKMNILEPF